jgi:hypothetical protein
MAAVGAVMTAAAPYLLGAAAGAQVLGGFMEAGQANRQASAYEDAADAARAQAKNAAAQERDKYRRLASGQRAQYGASGVDVNEGSPIDVLADTDAEGEVSAMQLLYSGELEAWNQKQKAAAARSKATGSIISGIAGGLSTGLLGASKLGLIGGSPATAISHGKDLYNNAGIGALYGNWAK